MRYRAGGFFTTILMCMILVLASVSTAFGTLEIKGLEKKHFSYVPGEIIVKFKLSATEQEKDLIKGKIGLSSLKKYPLTGSELFKLTKGLNPEEAVNKLKKFSNIEYVQPNYVLFAQSTVQYVNDPLFNEQWGLNNDSQTGCISDIDIDAPEAWNITQGKQDIKIAVIDTGIDINHPDLAGNIWTNPGEIPGDGIDNDNNGYIDDVQGWDFYFNDNTIFHPDNGGDLHGTHVAGIIAAEANNAIGIAGAAPGIKIMPIQYLSPDGTAPTSVAIEAIEYAKKMGAKVANISWGTTGTVDNAALQDAINNSDMVIVAAAGNFNKNNDVTPFYPASFDSPNIISVAAVNSIGALWSYSNYGVTSVDVGAPGVNILSTKPVTAGTDPTQAYQYLSGTSMAAPYVSGVAALVFSVDPQQNPAQVVEIIKSTVKPSADLENKTVSGGIVNAYRSLLAAQGKPYITSTDPKNGAAYFQTDKPLTITFNENILPDTNFNNITLKAGDVSVPCTSTLNGNILNIIPSSPLSQGTAYIVDIPSQAVKDAEGNFLAWSSSFHFHLSQAPTVNLVSPTNYALLSNAGSNVILKANATDDTGVSKVEFYVDNNLIGEAKSSPYTCYWQSTAGKHILTAKAYDNDGLTSVSNLVNVSAPAKVSLVNPTHLSTVKGTVYNMEAVFSDPINGNANLYIDGVFKAQVSAPGATNVRFNYNWDTTIYSDNSSHVISISAYTASGNIYSRGQCQVYVNNRDAGSPVVKITNPLINSIQKPAGTVIPITANVTDDLGVSRVEFYIDNIFVGQDTSAPYIFNWTSTVGKHSITAKAYDVEGKFGWSSPVYIRVPATVLITNPINNSEVSGVVSQFTAILSSPVSGWTYLYIDGTLVKRIWTDNMTTVKIPYLWNTEQYQNGTSHVIRIGGYTRTGSVWSEAQSVITINNQKIVPTNITAMRLGTVPISEAIWANLNSEAIKNMLL